MPLPLVYKKRGWRQFLNLAIRLCRFAAKHQTNIKEEGPSGTDALVDTLITLLPTLLSLREPGPD